MNSDKGKTLAAIRLHPAVIVLGGLAIGFAGHELWTPDLDGVLFPVLRKLGQGLFILGILMLVFAYGAMLRSRTTIDPRTHTTRIVSTGIYRLSRNPIYFGWFVVMLGLGLKNLSLFQIVISVLMIGLLHWVVVLPEEEYLEDTFGGEYLRYRDKVRRWL